MSKWGDRLKRVEQLAQSFHQNPLTIRYKPRLWPCQPSSVWKLFPRQSCAMSFAQSCKEVVHVFALEKENAPQGQRIYLVTSYSELWHYYRTFPQSLMHCYEVIPEGAVCKLYFDLEFHKPSNKMADGRMMVSMLIQYVCDKLLECYGVECSGKNVLNLDSSTEEKFSRHLIFSLQNAAFKDNIHVGKFINAILKHATNKGNSGRDQDDAINSEAKHAAERRPAVPERKPARAGGMTESPPTKRRKQEDLSFLQVKTKDGLDGLFVDLGVYTRNRNFRLYKSSKVGKTAAFKVAEENQFSSSVEKGISSEESIFLASLVCNVSFTGQRILTWDVPEANEHKIKTALHHQQESASHSAATFSGGMSSPHQEVDDFILTVVRKDDIQGSIRRWNYFPAEQLLVYDIAKYRWCENVGRFHKSNNIMIIVDLKEEVWYQKCHDPECRNFRSSSYPLPREICVSYAMSLDEEDQTFLMDDAGTIEASQTQSQTKQTTDTQKPADTWDSELDDLEKLDSLNEFEKSSGEISDGLLLSCMADFDSQEEVHAEVNIEVE